MLKISEEAKQFIEAYENKYIKYMSQKSEKLSVKENNNE